MSTPETPRRKFWGWGYEGQGPNAEQQGRIAQLLAARFAIDVPAITPPPRIAELTLRAPRIAPPASLAHPALRTFLEQTRPAFPVTQRRQLELLSRSPLADHA